MSPLVLLSKDAWFDRLTLSGFSAPPLAIIFCCLLAVGTVVPACTSPPPPGPPDATPGPSEGAEWERVVAAAREEGRIAIAGPIGEGWSQTVLSFQREIPGIQIQYAGMDSPEFFQRLELEREDGRPMWDLRIGDLSPEVFAARDRGSLEPVRPLLFHPEILDDRLWMGGVDGLFDLDGERRWFAGFTVQLRTVAWVNRDIVPRDELRSVRDLVDPKWRGKIVIHDPRGGSGLATLALLLDAYGEGFVRELLGAPGVVVTQDSLQLAEWVILGQYPIGVGYTTDLARRFLQQGVLVNVHPLEEGPLGISAGPGTLQVVRGGPHPNAARLFANWLLTRSAQDRLAQSTGVNSRRIDVWPGDPLLVPDPQRVKDFVCVTCERYLPLQARALQIAREIVG